LLCKIKKIVSQPNDVKTECNLAESSEEGCASKMVVLLLMMIIEH
jgi:hypothetical protein